MRPASAMGASRVRRRAPLTGNPSTVNRKIDWDKWPAAFRDDMRLAVWNLINGQLRPTFLHGHGAGSGAASPGARAGKPPGGAARSPSGLTMARPQRQEGKPPSRKRLLLVLLSVWEMTRQGYSAALRQAGGGGNA